MTVKEVKQAVRDALAGKKVSVAALAFILNIAKRVYYNSGDGVHQSLVTFFEQNVGDNEFDHLEDILRERSPNHKYFQNNTGAPIGNAKERKVHLPVPMPSLDKMKPDSKNLAAFLAKGPFVVSIKLDGVSLLIQTKGKKLYTRGNGSVGQDISYMWDALKLPSNIRGDHTLRAEMIISKEAFERNKRAFSGKTEAKNARNTMSGIVNSGSVTSALKHVDVLVYAVIGKKPSEAFALAESLGFDTPFWKKVDKLNLDSLQKYLEKVKAGKYEADGLVVARDVKEMPSTSNPENTIAFKNNTLADQKEFVVEGVEWQVSKHGKLKPVLLLEPQQLDGVTVKRCTAFNAKYIKDNNIGPGSKVKLVRSGGVIPHVLEVTKSTKAQMPKEKFAWSGVDAILVDAEESDEVAVKKVAAFFKHLGAEGISQKLFEKLHVNGYDTLKKILKVKKSDLLELPGIQSKSAATIYNQIQSVKEATLADYMAASGCFPPVIASTRINAVLSKHPNILEFRPKAMATIIKAIPGFSDITVNAFIAGAEAFKVWMKDLKGILVVKEPKKVKAKGSSMKGVFVVPTGFRFSKEEQQAIEEQGGTVQASINKTTTHVVAKDIGSGSSKIDKAKQAGLAVMSLAAFKKKYKI